MNLIGYIVIVAIITDCLLHGFADLLNLKMLSNKIPDEFVGIYDEKDYKKSQEYLKTNTKFGWATSFFDLITILVFWFGKGFLFLDNIVRSFDLNPVATGLIYMGILILFKSLLGLPFSIYSTFVIEEKFGFNKTGWKTFIMDLIKGVIISILLGAPLIAGILLFFQYAGDYSWLYCWVAVVVFILSVQFIAPTYIMPLFNKFKEIEDGELKDSIVSYSKKIDFPLKKIFIMDGSKRSGKSNAFFTGFGNNKRIVLFDTLVEQHSVSELVSILAHEMGHYKKKHILKNIIISTMQIGIIFFLLSIFISYQPLFDAFYIKEKSVYAGLIFFGMLYSPIGFFTGIFTQYISRKNENEADRFAVETNENIDSMINALKKLSVYNLSNLTPHPFYVFLNYSHPPVLERIKPLASYRPSHT
ncbi:STE24 endopeptidase [Desulfosarcina sp. BuS5]|uniref:M48 family metallopeptidase n=1 Tax=Desulfosarcina sp. BuS5 TaxID=933262 RepID=UPI00054E7F36|nr:M48 family metallopeptidase [Desulfosarcina sp. BuS5]WDN89729.1 STE24 endopeptidase [Desulfosarcina sp. BuS5]